MRDLVPEKIKNLGEETEVYEMIEDEEYLQELRKKVQEEALELSAAMDKKTVVKELADLLIVVDHLLVAQDVSAEDIKLAKQVSIEKKGGFSKRFFMKWSSDSGYEARKQSRK